MLQWQCETQGAVSCSWWCLVWITWAADLACPRFWRIGQCEVPRHNMDLGPVCSRHRTDSGGRTPWETEQRQSQNRRIGIASARRVRGFLCSNADGEKTHFFSPWRGKKSGLFLGGSDPIQYWPRKTAPSFWWARSSSEAGFPQPCGHLLRGPLTCVGPPYLKRWNSG